MSFGGGGFGSSGFGSNNSNNNNQSGGLFGSGGFGSNNTNSATGFGSSSNTGFGSNNTGGSIFGGGNSNSGNTGFGSGSGFGSNTNTNTGSSTLFGGNRPGFGSNNASSGGGGLFGASNNTGGGFGSGGFGANTANTSNTSGFGASNTGGGIFGASNNNNNNANTSSGFGSSNAGGGLFGGGSGASTGFGASTNTNAGGFGSGSGFGQPSQQNPGTGGQPFSAFVEKEGANNTNHYQSITFQQPYLGWSFEELRVQDYDQGRKYGNQNGQGGAFGQATGFGATNSSNSLFGNANNSSGSFGSGGFANQQNASGGFGSQQNTGFGSSTSGGLFGQQNKPSLFGNNTATTSQGGGGLFGTANNSTNTGGSLFGSNNTNSNSGAGGGGFGSASKPAFGSGSTGGFGSNNAAGGNAFGSFGSQNQQSTQGQGSLFGGTGGGFGSNQNNNPQPKSLFGNNSTTGGSLFGNSAPNGQQGQNAFGGPTNQANTGNSLFGSKPAGSGSLFGNTNSNANTGSSLFGNNNNPQNQQQNAGGLFGQPKPSLFGSNNTNANPGFGGSTFGSTLTQNTNQQNAGGGLFGNTNQSQPQPSNSLFGNSFGNSLQLQQSQQPQQPTFLTASQHNHSPYGHKALFADLGYTTDPNIGPIATPLRNSTSTRRPAPLPQWKVNPTASTRLITPAKRPGSYGFSYSTYGTPGSAYASPSMSGSVGRSLNKSLSVGNIRSTVNPEESLLNPTAFSPSLRASTGQSMKRLHIDRSLRTDFFGYGDSHRASPLKKTVSFETNGVENSSGGPSNALVRRQDSDRTPENDLGYLRSSTRQAATGGENETPTTNPVNGDNHASDSATPPVTTNQQTPPASQDFSRVAEEARANHDDQPIGGYWSSPTISDLKSMSRDQLRSIKNFTVGRHGAGKIVFDEVNLESVPLDEIFGQIVLLDMRQATVYPNHVSKPPEGKDLNVPSTCYVENSWPRAQQGRVKVMETGGPRFEKHLERLRRVGGTKFESYDVESGIWKFRVDHFSTYQLDYEENLSSSLLTAPPDTLGPTPVGMQADVSMLSNHSSLRNSKVDDTFEFRKTGKSLPGAFDLESFDAAFVSGLEDADTDHGIDEFAIQGNYGNPFRHANTGTEANEPPNSSIVGRYPPALDGQDERLPAYSSASTPLTEPRSTLGQAQQHSPHFRNTPSKRLIDVEEDTWAKQLQRTLSPKKQDRQTLRESQGLLLQDKRFQGASPLKQGAEKPFANSIDIMNSLFGKKSVENPRAGRKQAAMDKGFKLPYPKRARLDEQLGELTEVDRAFHQSFKPRFSPGETFLCLQPRRSLITRMPSTSPPAANPMSFHASKVFPAPTLSRAFIYYQSIASVSDDDDSDCPRARPPRKFDFASFASSFSANDMAQKTVWQLLQILFDDQDSASGREAVALARKSLLSKLWKSVVTPEALVQARQSSTAEDRALAYLSANDVWSATESLLAGGDPKLATAVSQIDSSETRGRTAIHDQIEQWRSSNSISEIPHRVRALYDILSGSVCTAVGKTGAGPENRAETFCIANMAGLDWRRAFGLRLWYALLQDDPLEAAVDAYNRDLESGEEKVRPLLQMDSSSESQTVDRIDVLWSLLKLYAARQDKLQVDQKDILNLLTAENASGDPLDAQVSFLLCQTLSARRLLEHGIESSFSESTDQSDESPQLAVVADSITSTFLAQLSAQPKDLVAALFVSLHFSHSATRQSAAQDILTLHAGSIGASPQTCAIWREMEQSLHIPPAWVWKAKATYARAVQKNEKARALYLLRAELFPEACQALRYLVAPSAVVAEEVLPPRAAQDDTLTGHELPADLKSILSEFESSSEAVKLVEWKKGLGGKQYSNFVSLVERVDKKKRSGLTRYTEGEAKEMQKLLKEIRRAVSPIVEATDDEPTLQERVAAWEMNRVLVETERVLREQGDEEFGFQLQDDTHDTNSRHAMLGSVDERISKYRQIAGFA